MAADLVRRAGAELIGTALLLAAVVGSGIMADRLTDDAALTLLANTLPVGAMLVVLVTVFGPVSGAHLNPAVTLAFALRREIPAVEVPIYMAAQLAGALAGVALAHAMFDLPLFERSQTVRTGGGQWLGEGLATFCLVLAILAGRRFRPDAVPWLVGLVIVAAYWFTSSTSFANPAVTLARSLSDTFTGIRPADVTGFVVAELAGALLAAGVGGWLFESSRLDAEAGAVNPLRPSRPMP